MQSRLEDVLREKERELKLHEKYENLVRFCGEDVFPSTRLPLQRHIETLKDFIEKLIPEPRDRREEMFSGEVFVLLCTLYFHDMGVVSRFGRVVRGEMPYGVESRSKTLFLNNEIGKRFQIPEKALELINSLVFSVRKIPLEWEIREDTRRAIVRNSRMLGGIFDFAHLMWDIFSPDAGHTVLRRLQNSDLRLHFGDASLSVDSKDGAIFIKCRPEVPYQVHVLGKIRDHVETLFKRFKECVNGRLGFQYRQIVWDMEEVSERPVARAPAPAAPALDGPWDQPLTGWEEASRLLDILFRHGHAIVVGDGATGRTTMINSFVLPQLSHISRNVFCTEIWDRPVEQIREAIDRAGRTSPGGAVDIVSTCTRLLQEGPCFFIIDGCERLGTVDDGEREKLERLVDFCFDNENTYLIALGDKEDFFDWYMPFRRSSLSAVLELAPPPRPEPEFAAWQRGSILAERFRGGVDEIVRKAPSEIDLREVVFVLAGGGDRTLRRYRLADISFETCIPEERIVQCLRLLEENGIVREQEVFNARFYALSSRHIAAGLWDQLRLNQFAEKKELRDVLSDACQNGLLLDKEALHRIEALKERMMFTRGEMGLILASMARLDKDFASLLNKAERSTQGFATEHLLSLLSDEDAAVRARAIRLLAKVKDEGLINPLLAHLRNETDAEVRRLLVEAFVAFGKRRTVVALMSTLAEIGDRDAKIDAIGHVYRLPPRRARELLIEIADVEKDPEVIDRLDKLVIQLEQ